ncbi:type II secretion system protein GspK [Acidiphilium sp. C61]|jgi:general secretion pathway protein K|uniref:type II secretion system protein GspK n=1 Tax=Acidiphilium sp. C61 TaxID=1671485 RepID=UPI00157B04E8|nr:type II secretion system protein GspK [Acidiphilium sp. C61]
MARPRRHDDRGFALLIVLAVLVLFGFLVTRLLVAARQQMAIAGNLRDAAVAAAAAEGGVWLAVARLDAGGAAPGEVRIGASQVRLATSGVAGRINPDTAPAPLLAALFRVGGMAAAPAGSLAETLTEARDPALAPASLATLIARYRAAGSAEGPPQAPFRSLAELASLPGMTPGLLARLRPHLSLYAPALPDLASADAAVRAAVGLAGRIDVPGGHVSGPPVMRIEAVATGPGLAHAARCATVRLTPANVDAPYIVLDWSDARCG